LLPATFHGSFAFLIGFDRVDEARERIAQLLKARPHERIRPEFVRRHNRNQASAEAWIAALPRRACPLCPRERTIPDLLAHAPVLPSQMTQ
jgi:hypothetical protein